MSDRLLQGASEPGVADTETSSIGRGTTGAVRTLARRALACAAIGMALMALAACNDQDTGSADGISTAIEMPRGLGSLRAIEQERLILEVTLDSEPLQLERRGQTHSVSFELTSNRNYELNVRFSYRPTGRSEPIILAEIEQPRQINLALVSRTIRISKDDYNEVFDDDNDLIHNIDEVRDGTDPLDDESPRIQSGGPLNANLVDMTPMNAVLWKIVWFSMRKVATVDRQQT